MARFRVLLIFTLFTFLIFLPIFFGKVNLNGNLLVSFYPPYGQNLPFKNTGWDQLRIYFPFYKVTLDSIRHLQIPFWNPYAFSGHPHMADFQTAVFYPLNIFGLFLPQITFWHLMRLTPTILASFFMFLYLNNLHLSRHPELDSGSRAQIPNRVRNDNKKGLSTIAAIFGALTFGFSPFILTWGEEVVMSPHSIVWMPLILYATDRFLATGKKVFPAIIAVSSAFSFFGGYMQTSIYMFVFIFAYIIFRIWQTRRSRFVEFFRNGIVIGLSFVLGIGLAAVQLLPSAELFFNAARSQVTLRETLFKFLLPPEGIFTYFAPDFFGHPATANFFRRGSAQYYEGILFVGIAALIFAMFAIFSKWKASKFVKFLTISGLIALLSTFDWPGAKLFLSLPIPFLSSSIANRVLFIPAFCLAVLGAIEFDQWEAKGGRNIYKVILAFSGILAGLIFSLAVISIFNLSYFEHANFQSVQNVVVSFRNLVVPIVVFSATVLVIAFSTVFAWMSRRIAAVLIIVFAAAHIFYFSQKYLSFSERQYVFGDVPVLSFIQNHQGIWRSWGLGDGYLENNLATQYGIYFPEGYDSLNNRSYGEFTFAMQGNKLDDWQFRADAGIGRSSAAELLDNEDRRKLIDLLGVKYLIAKRDDFDLVESKNFEKVFEADQYGVFENKQVMPRIFLASNYEGPPDIFGQEPETERQKKQRDKERRKLIPQKLLSPDFDLKNVLILEKPSPISPQFGDGSVEVIKYEAQEVVVRTKSQEPKLLFISDNYYPGWKAKVDGDETEILRSDYTFRAVPLTPGEHTVRFYFDSLIFKIGVVVSLISAGALLFLL